MSLKTFHIIFCVLTTLLFIFLALWGFILAPASMADSAVKLAYAGIVGAIIMPIYGVCFYRKSKHIII